MFKSEFEIAVAKYIADYKARIENSQARKDLSANQKEIYRNLYNVAITTAERTLREFQRTKEDEEKEVK